MNQQEEAQLALRLVTAMRTYRHADHDHKECKEAHQVLDSVLVDIQPESVLNLCLSLASLVTYFADEEDIQELALEAATL